MLYQLMFNKHKNFLSKTIYIFSFEILFLFIKKNYKKIICCISYCGYIYIL